MRVCVCWSGGKNSTRAVMEYHQRGYKVTALCYIPMFKENIPLIDLDHYNFILRCANSVYKRKKLLRIIHCVVSIGLSKMMSLFAVTALSCPSWMILLFINAVTTNNGIKIDEFVVQIVDNYEK